MLDAAFERLDAADIGPREPAPVDPGLKVDEQLLSERLIAADETALYPGLPFPCAAKLVVVIERGREPRHRRPDTAMRPQPQVHAIRAAEVGRLADQPHGLLHGPLEKLLVGAGLRPLGPPLERIDEDEVDVARIVELGAAELAERDRREGRPLAPRAAGHAPLFLEPGDGRPHCRIDDRIGHVRNLRHDGLQPLAADDVAVGDPQRLPPLEPPQGPHHVIWVRHCLHVGAERSRHRLALLRPPLPEPHLLPRFGVGNHDIGQIRTGREQLDERGERLRIAIAEGSGGKWTAHGREESLHRHEHAVGIGHLRQQRGELVGDHAEQVEGHPERGERGKRALRTSRVGEPGRPAPGHRGVRVVEQPHHGVGGRHVIPPRVRRASRAARSGAPAHRRAVWHRPGRPTRVPRATRHRPR